MVYFDNQDQILQWLESFRNDSLIPNISELPLHLDETHHLYVSSAESPLDETELTNRQITAILTLSDNFEVERMDRHLTSKFVSTADYWDQNIPQRLDEIYAFLSTHLRNGNVLLHCVSITPQRIPTILF